MRKLMLRGSLLFLLLLGVGGVGYWYYTTYQAKAASAQATQDSHGHGHDHDHDHAGHNHDHGTESGGGHAHEDEHGHGLPMVQNTIWSEPLELLASHHAAVADQAIALDIYLTDTTTGEPLTGANVTVTTESAGRRRQATATTGPSDGTARLQLPAHTAGEYSVRLRLEHPSLADNPVRFELPKMTVYATAHEASEAAASQAGEISFAKDRQWRIGLQTEILQPQEIVEELIVPGKVVIQHGLEAKVPPPVAGIIVPPVSGRFPQVGDRVSQGQVLAIIEPTVLGAGAVELLVNRVQLEALDAELAAKQLDAETQLSSAQLSLQLAQQTYDRISSLAEQGITEGKRLLEARNDLEAAEVRLGGLSQLLETYQQTRQRITGYLRAQTNTSVTSSERGDLAVELHSPLSGTIVEAYATQGEFVDQAHPLFRVLNLDVVLIEAQLSEYDLAKINENAVARYRLHAYPDEIVSIDGPEEGLEFMANIMDEQSRTIPIRYRVRNSAGRLRVGMFADVLLPVGKPREGFLIPEEAVIDDAGQPVVYVQVGGDSFVAQPVQLGARIGRNLEILAGLEPGARIVTAGGYAIRLASLTAGVPEHHH